MRVTMGLSMLACTLGRSTSSCNCFLRKRKNITEAPAICIDDTAAAEECCVPLASDEGGHPSCTARRGMKSFCNFSGLGTGACTGMSSLCGCNDKPAEFCTDQDPTSSCDPIGNCCKSRRCRDRGDEYCRLTFGMGSTCTDGADGIKLCEIPN